MYQIQVPTTHTVQVIIGLPFNRVFVCVLRYKIVICIDWVRDCLYHKMLPFVRSAGDWVCPCGSTQFGDRPNCAKCDAPKSFGTVLHRGNMKCARKRKRRSKQPIKVQSTNGSIVHRLTRWSTYNPYGKNVKVVLEDKTWIATIVKVARNSRGAHIHSNTSKWKYYKINLGTQVPNTKEYLSISCDMRRTLQMVAEQCIQTALTEVCQYNNCLRKSGISGAVWTLPCGEAREICSLLYQPNGSLRQQIHKDGHRRFTKADAPDDIYFNYFLNVIVPMIGDIPTLCRGPDRELRGCDMCQNDEIRIFDGGVWHAGAANVTGEGVWKLFLGLVPDSNPTAGETPVFEEGTGKNMGKYKDRLILVADDSR